MSPIRTASVSALGRMPSTSKKRLFSQFSDLTKGDNLKAHGYKAEILEDEVEHFARNRGTGVTFRFRVLSLRMRL